MDVTTSKRVRANQRKRNGIRNDALNKLNLELVHKYQAGDERALTVLLEVNKGMLIMVARGYASTGIPMEELLASASYGYCLGIQRFNESLGSRLNSFATDWARSQISRLVKFHTSKKRKSWLVSYEDTIEHTGGIGHFYSNTAEDPGFLRRPNAEQIRMMVEYVEGIRWSIATKLKPLEKFVLCRHYGFDDRKGPMSYSQIESSEEFRFTDAYAKILCDSALQKIHVSKQRFLIIVEAMNVLDAER